MSKFAAIVNAIAGCVFAMIGGFVVCRTSAFLSAAPRDQLGQIAWAFLINAVGIYLVICGLGRVRRGTSRLQDDEVQDDR